MLRLFRNKKAQSTAEYAILIGLVVAAVIGMQTYVKRGIQGRYKDAGDASVAAVGNDVESWAAIGGKTGVVPMNQYEPEGLSARSTSTTLIGSKDTSQMGYGGKVIRTTNQETRQAVGDYQQYNYTPPLVSPPGGSGGS